MEIIIIKFFGIGSNCYLIKNNNEFVLIDTASKFDRKKLLSKLIKHNCIPTKLKMIILTHADFDHSGNAAYLKNIYTCPILMHTSEECIVSNQDMFINRSHKNKIIKELVNKFLNIEKFETDFFIDLDRSLNIIGIPMHFVNISGHSKGSLGILIENDILFIGDLIANLNKPKLYFIDSIKDAEKSLDKIQKLNVKKVFPGHGNSFKLSELAL